MIKPIRTTYNGTTYRSRTEARWAVFFDMERIPFRYENEGYQAGMGWYVPDFEMVEADELVVFEVKPFAPTPDEMKKMMVKIVPTLQKYGAHLALTVHDELDGWVAKDRAEEFDAELKEVMESVTLPYGVRLLTSGGLGENWGEAH